MEHDANLSESNVVAAQGFAGPRIRTADVLVQVYLIRRVLCSSEPATQRVELQAQLDASNA